MKTEFPAIFAVDQAVDWFKADPDRSDETNVSDALLKMGRNSEPALLCDLESEGLLSPALAAKFVGSAWSGCEYPDRALARDEWKGLFELAGYTVDGVAAERPVGPIRLYRGTVPERSGDWSWTDNIEVAKGYAAGTSACRPVGGVYTAEVPAASLLARNNYRGEGEYVVDTEGLHITVIE